MKKLRIGVAGLGRAFTPMLPALSRDPRVELVAAADPRPEARSKSEAVFQAKSFVSVEELCKHPAIDEVYIATAYQFHSAQARLAAAHAKHLLVGYPMA